MKTKFLNASPGNGGRRLALYDKTIYPQLAQTIAPDELAVCFTPTEEEIDFTTKSARLPASRLTILVLLKLFQKLHRFPNPEEVPGAVVDHIRIQLGLGVAVAFEYENPVQRARQRDAIREYTSFMAWSKEARHMAAQTGYQAALVMGRPADISNAIIAALTHAGFELPAFSTLERATRHGRALAHRKVCGDVFRRLTADERRALDKLLVIAVDRRRTAFQAIKRLPQRPSRKHLKESVDHLEWQESLGNVGTELKDIAPSLIHDFAKQARTADAGELKDFTSAKRYTLLLSLIHRTKARTRDAVAGTAVKRIATIHKRAKNELLERQAEQRERVDRLLGRLGEVIEIVAKERSDQRVGEQVRTTLTQPEPIERLQEEYSTAKNWTGNNYLPLLWRHYKGNRSVLFRAIHALNVKSANEDNSIIEAWTLVGEKSNRRADWITVPSEVLHFASPRWRALLRHPTDPTLINRRQFEICVLSHIADHLQAGNLCAPGSEAFADHRAELLPWRECERRLKEYCERVNLPATADEFVKELQRDWRRWLPE